MFELKRLSRDGVPAALDKATRYRLLNEPTEAESICRDVLALEPDHPVALTTLLLALTDQFEERLDPCLPQAKELLARLPDDYSRAYYRGLIAERQAKVDWKRRTPYSASMAYEGLRQAMEHFERAAELRPAGNDDALLRWNTCARLLMSHRELIPAPVETETLLLE